MGTAASRNFLVLLEILLGLASHFNLTAALEDPNEIGVSKLEVSDFRAVAQHRATSAVITSDDTCAITDRKAGHRADRRIKHNPASRSRAYGVGLVDYKLGGDFPRGFVHCDGNWEIAR